MPSLVCCPGNSHADFWSFFYVCLCLLQDPVPQISLTSTFLNAELCLPSSARSCALLEFFSSYVTRKKQSYQKITHVRVCVRVCVDILCICIFPWSGIPVLYNTVVQCLKTVVLYILSNFLLVYDRKVSLVLVLHHGWKQK